MRPIWDEFSLLAGPGASQKEPTVRERHQAAHKQIHQRIRNNGHGEAHNGPPDIGTVTSIGCHVEAESWPERNKEPIRRSFNRQYLEIERPWSRHGARNPTAKKLQVVLDKERVIASPS
jgi:hypothetical protein